MGERERKRLARFYLIGWALLVVVMWPLPLWRILVAVFLVVFLMGAADRVRQWSRGHEEP